MRSPSAKVAAIAQASSRQVHPKPDSEAGFRGEHRVQQSAEADAGKRDGDDQAEGEDRSAEQRREQPIPDELHQEEREADGAGGEEQDPDGTCTGGRAGRLEC